MQACGPEQFTSDYQCDELEIDISGSPTGPPWTLFLPADPTRICIVINGGTNNTQACSITTNVDAPAGCGVLFGQQNDQTIIHYRDYGPLVGYAWYWSSGFDYSTLSVFTISFRPTGVK